MISAQFHTFWHALPENCINNHKIKDHKASTGQDFHFCDPWLLEELFGWVKVVRLAEFS